MTVNGVTLRRFEDYKNGAYGSLADLIGDALPTERYGNIEALELAEKVVPAQGAPRVLDIGCGSGKTRPVVEGFNPAVDWHGIEIAETYNIDDIDRLPDRIQIYDGVNIPAEDGAFDICFSKQVFEHVRHPEALLDEIHRVLGPGGKFVGSLSGGEPYHWHSLFHFTALGWKTVLEDHGFRLNAIYAGIDALTLLLHHWSENRKDMGRYFREPFLNLSIGAEKKSNPQAIRYENALKLAFAGHLVFDADRL